MQRRDFIKYCLGCSCLLFMSGGLYYTKHITPNTDENNADDKNSILHIEIHLTEHCNLKCKYCSHFSAIAKEEYYDVNKYKKDMKRLSKITGGKINVIQLLGGEPLLHPEINKLMNITRFYFPHTTIDIITNGLLLDKMPDSFWSNLTDKNINLLISLYPIKLNWDLIFEKKKKFGCQIKSETFDGTIDLTPNNIEKYTIKEFYKVMIDETGSQPKDNQCWAKIICTNFINGKIYPCFVASNIRHFNSYFNKNIKLTNEDYIDIYKINSINQILDFLKQKNNICKYCRDLRFANSVAWECTQKHSISEWT